MNKKPVQSQLYSLWLLHSNETYADTTAQLHSLMYME